MRNRPLSGAAPVALLSLASHAQVTVYTCSFDQPPYALGSIDGQNSWVTAQAGAAAPGLTALRIASDANTLAPQAGNGCLISESGPNSSTSGRFAYQFGTGTPIIDAVAAACAANATAIEFTCYVVPPTPETSGTQGVGARHGMVLYAVDPTGANTSLKAAAGFQVRSFDRQVFVVQWLDVGQLGVTAAGNYLINFTTPLQLNAGAWNLVGCKWDRATGTPNVKINAGEWTPVVTTSIVNYVPREFDIVNTRGSTSGGATNTVATTAYMDSLTIRATGYSPGPSCRGDLNLDAAVNGTDLAALLASWGPCGGCAADINADGTVNGADLGLLLTGWGACSAFTPSWATAVEPYPNPAVVTDANLRARITATGIAWRVRDSATQIEMLLVPPGTYQMGCSPTSQVGCFAWENPVHQVTLTRPFYVGRYEVTQAQWQAAMGTNPSFFQGSAFPDAANRPVEQVGWSTVQGFLTATGMRLLTEAEWEFACRAGTTSAFNNGSNDDASLGEVAWYYANSQGQTRVVGQKPANRLGLHDMHGNVWEWVSDWYGDYGSAAQVDPSGPASGATRVLRGGGWNYGVPYYARSSFRSGGTAPSTGDRGIGFRVARNP